MLIDRRAKIASNYLKFWFWIDIISSFPYDDVISSFQSSASNSNTMLLKFFRFLKFVKIVRLIRALKLKRLFAKLEGIMFYYIVEYISFASVINSILSFLKLCVLILCIAHWCACIWFSITLW